MAVKATKVFSKHEECYDDEADEFIDSGDPIFDFPGLQYIENREESMALNRLRGPLVIISASGMCTGGRILYHLKHHLHRRSTTLLFVGYQATGTLGRKLQNGARSVQIFGDRIRVRARVQDLGSFSAHSDQAALVDWINKLEKAPSATFLVHGEEDALFALEDKLEKDGKHFTYVPSLGEEIELSEKALADIRTVREVVPGKEDDVEVELASELADFERSVEAAGDKLEELVGALESWACGCEDKLTGIRGSARILERIVASLTNLSLEGVEGTERTIARLSKDLENVDTLTALEQVRSELTEASERADDLAETL